MSNSSQLALHWLHILVLLMSNRDPWVIGLVLLISIAATTLGIRNLIWYVHMTEQTINADR